MHKPLSVQDVLMRVRLKIKEIDEVRLYYELRKRQIKYCRNTKILKIVIGLVVSGFPITSNLVKAMGEYNDVGDVIASLHLLGDKHLLVLKRVLGKRYKWIPSAILKDIISCVFKEKD